MNFISKVWNTIKPQSRREQDEAYLAKATDLTDLERRIKKLENDNLSGWI
jgi:hypothetical protein